MKHGSTQQVVGGAEAYTAACRACYHSLNTDKAQAAPLTERNRRTQTKRSALARPHCAFKLCASTLQHVSHLLCRQPADCCCLHDRHAKLRLAPLSYSLSILISNLRYEMFHVGWRKGHPLPGV